MSIKSPCILVCALDPEAGLCLGCARSAEEIGNWTNYSAAERERIMAELPNRMAVLEADGKRPTDGSPDTGDG